MTPNERIEDGLRRMYRDDVPQNGWERGVERRIGRQARIRVAVVLGALVVVAVALAIAVTP